jgi:ribonuclease D
MVVQLALPGEDEITIVDALKLPDLQELAAALASVTIVGHALGSDLKIFADRYEQLPATAFDTQLAAAFCGYGPSISLADLVRDITNVRLRKSQTVSDWSLRPFSLQQLEYLVDDVRYLFPLYERLTERLIEGGRLAWYEDEARDLVDLARYRPDPERIYLKIPGASRMNRRDLGILRELAILRERLARERDLPVRYILADDVMAGIVALRPSAIEDLAQLRRFDAGARKSLGDRVVAAVGTALALDEDELPRRSVRPSGPDRDALAAALAVLVGGIAERNQLPASLLLSRATIERIAREFPETYKAMEELLGAGTWRADLLARPLTDLLHGRTVIGVERDALGEPRVTAREIDVKELP